MANIQTDVSKIDSRKTAERKGFLLPYQLDWVYDENRFKICEKSIRIGWTFAQEFWAVRGRLATKTDYLHSSVTQGVALNFVRECGFWIEQYKIRGTSIGETDYVDELNNINARALYIEFPNKSRIVSFSSSPNAMRGFGGAVGLDEIAFHRCMAEMIKGAGGRAVWGDPVSMWSSHHGVSSEFNQFLRKLRADENCRWSIYRVTIEDALDMGLLDKINSTKGLKLTREEFLADCKTMVGSLDAYDEEFMCNPKEDGLPLVTWYDLSAAQADYPIIHHQIEGDAGPNDRTDPSVEELLRDNVFAALPRGGRYALGYDIARTGHLSSINIIGTDGKNHRHELMVNLHKCKFPSQRAVVAQAFDTHRYLTGAGDKTGLGRETCEELERMFPGRFVGVDFGAAKPHLAGKLAAAFADRRMTIPAKPEEIAYDIHGVSTKQLTTRMSYVESRNPCNQYSHCDMCWSLALAIANAEDGDANLGPVFVESARPSVKIATRQNDDEWGFLRRRLDDF